MRRNLALAASFRPHHHAARPVANLAFVVALALACWAGVAWIVEILLRLHRLGY